MYIISIVYLNQISTTRFASILLIISQQSHRIIYIYIYIYIYLYIYIYIYLYTIDTVMILHYNILITLFYENYTHNIQN